MMEKSWRFDESGNYKIINHRKIEDDIIISKSGREKRNIRRARERKLGSTTSRSES